MPKDLIERARKFAALADKATPGPWAWVNWSARPHVCPGVIGDRLGVSVSAHRTRADREDADGMLIAAAPEMAQLLAEVADELEDVSRLVDKAAGVIGTADEYRSTACIEVALDWCARLKDEVKTLRSKTNELERTRQRWLEEEAQCEEENDA